MKNSFCCVLSVGVVALLATGCASTSENSERNQPVAPMAIQSADLPQVIAVGKNIGNALLTALQKNDYSQVRDLPVGDGKTRFTEEKFKELYKRVQQQGGIAAFTYLGDLQMKPYHRLLWKVSFKDLPKHPGAGVDVLFEVVMINLNGANRAAGFSFRQ